MKVKKLCWHTSYLVDFFLVCDYLGAAGKAIAGDEQEQARWMDEQKIRLKTEQVSAVIQELRASLSNDLQLTRSNCIGLAKSGTESGWIWPNSAARNDPTCVLHGDVMS